MTAPTGRSGTGRIDYLDGIRAIAIGTVLSVHWLAYYLPFLDGGYIGVDVFFVLSGFIITTMLWRMPLPSSFAVAWWSFLRRRVVRLYPALIGLVVVSALLFAVTPSKLDGGEVARRGLLVLGQASSLWGATASPSGGTLLPALHPFPHTWSLAVEWYFYLLWPLAVFGARRLGLSARTVMRLSLLLAAVLYLGSMPLSDFWFYFGPTARFGELLVGCALALAFQAYGAPSRPWRFATPALFLALGFLAAYTLLAPEALSQVARWIGVPGTVLATVVLIVAGYSNPGAPAHRLLSHPWLAAIGRHSYSLYLWHVVPLLVLEGNWLGVPLPVLALTSVAAVAVLTVASYRWLEKPFLKARSDVLGARRVQTDGVRRGAPAR